MRIGIISFAHMHADSYATCLKQLPDVQLVGIVDRNETRGRKAAQRFNSHYYATAQELLALQLDGVIITAENSRHLEMVRLAAGITPYILLEKPIADTRHAGEAIIDLCAQRGTQLQIAFPVRFCPPIQRLKTMLEQERVGQVYAVRATNHGSMPGGWFTDKIMSGGGAVIDHTVHVIDVLRWLWHTEVVEVYAEIGYELLHPDLGIDDAGLLSFKLANGVIGTLDTSWSRPKSYPTWGDVTIEVVGERGMLEVDAFGQKIDLYSDAAGKGAWMPWGSNADLGLIKDFIDAIATRRAPSITGNDGLRALEVAVAAYRSAERGQLVSLPLT